MKKASFLTFLLLISIFQMYLLQILPLFTFFDEALTIWALFIIMKRRVFTIYKKMLFILSILTIWGIICNFKYNFQNDFFPIFNDIGNCFKVYITYIGASVYYNSETNFDKRAFINLSSRIIRVLVSIMFVCCIINLFVNIGMRQDIRFGLPSFAFIFGGAGKLSMIFYFIIPILVVDLYFHQRNSGNRMIYLYMALFVWLSTLRSRAILFVLLFIIGYCIMINKGVRLKMNIKTIVTVVLLFILVCIDQAELYLGNEATARYNLLYYGIKIMKDYFPFGGGFGTYGTDVAAKYYSKMYYIYDMDKVYGLSPDYPLFAHDSYWPAIMGQFGFIGILGFLALIFFMFKDVYDRSKGRNYLTFISLFIIITQIIASFATSVFFHFITVNLMFFIAILVSDNEKIKTRF